MLVNAFMPMISDFKNSVGAARLEKRELEESAVPSGDQKNNRMHFADSMHQKLQDLDIMLMKDKGVTTITKIVLDFDERIKSKQMRFQFQLKSADNSWLFTIF